MTSDTPPGGSSPHRSTRLGGGRREPARTIYGLAWSAAAHALSVIPDDVRPLHAELMARVEAGWVFVRPLLELATDEPGRLDASGPVGSFALETAEFFRDIAEVVLEWVSSAGAGGGGAHADTDSATAEVARFAVHAQVLALAAEAPGTDRRLRHLAQSLAREVAPWSDDMTAALQRIGAHWDLADGPDEGPPPDSARESPREGGGSR
jgi:hypothetical protein